jgi:hypothetical protein
VRDALANPALRGHTPIILFLTSKPISSDDPHALRDALANPALRGHTPIILFLTSRPISSDDPHALRDALANCATPRKKLSQK